MPGDRFGAWGERIAAEYLERRGWSVLARNYRLSRKEIDLIARQGCTIAFIEVKTRSDERFAHPLESLGIIQRRRIAEVAAAWVSEHGSEAEVYRFDLICVLRSREGEIRIDHLPDAWSAE